MYYIDQHYLLVRPHEINFKINSGSEHAYITSLLVSMGGLATYSIPLAGPVQHHHVASYMHPPRAAEKR